MGDRTLSTGDSRKKESPYENVGGNTVVIGMFYIFLFDYVYSLGKQLGKWETLENWFTLIYWSIFSSCTVILINHKLIFVSAKMYFSLLVNLGKLFETEFTFQG